MRLQAELQKTKTSLHETETELQNERERRERAEEKAKRLAADLAKQRDAKASSDKLHVNVGSIVAKSRSSGRLIAVSACADECTPDTVRFIAPVGSFKACANNTLGVKSPYDPNAKFMTLSTLIKAVKQQVDDPKTWLTGVPTNTDVLPHLHHLLDHALSTNGAAEPLGNVISDIKKQSNSDARNSPRTKPPPRRFVGVEGSTTIVNCKLLVRRNPQYGFTKHDMEKVTIDKVIDTLLCSRNTEFTLEVPNPDANFPFVLALTISGAFYRTVPKERRGRESTAVVTHYLHTTCVTYSATHDTVTIRGKVDINELSSCFEGALSALPIMRAPANDSDSE